MFQPARWSAVRPLGVAAVVALAAACSEPMAPQPDKAVAPTVSYITPVAIQPQAGIITVCKDGPAGTYDFTAAQVLENGAREGSLLQGASFSVDAGQCVNVWQAAPIPSGVTVDPQVRVNVSEVNLPAGIQFDSATVVTPTVPAQTYFDTPDTYATGNYWHGAVITFYNSETPPPPPPSPCVGLTPGYWKNWKNHYTEEQFLSLLPGTIAEGMTAKQATRILNGNGSDALKKLAKFVLANQLTLNLTGTDLPNPDGAYLDDTCVSAYSGTALGDALSQALTILAADGEGYTEAEILAVKDVLDAIANMGGDEG